jgi:histidine kinase/DNA gyrase B/HSP90-like ATPase
MGMGLSICRAIIEAYGGQLRATAKPHGATFQFTVPARRDTSAPKIDAGLTKSGMQRWQAAAVMAAASAALMLAATSSFRRPGMAGAQRFATSRGLGHSHVAHEFRMLA